MTPVKDHRPYFIKRGKLRKVRPVVGSNFSGKSVVTQKGFRGIESPQ